MRRFIHSLIRFRWLYLATVLAISAGAGWLLRDAALASSLGELLFGDSPKFQRYVERSLEFASDNAIAIAVHDTDLLSADSNQRLRELIETYEGLDYVMRVQSILDAQRTENIDGALYINAYADLVDQGDMTAAAARTAIQNDSVYKGLFLSRDGTYTAISIEIEDPNGAEIPAEQLPGIERTIRRIAVDAGFDADKLHTAGIPVMTAGMTEESYRNIEFVTPFNILALFLAGLFSFGRLFPVAIATVVVAISGLWSVGFAMLAFGQLNIMVTIVPAVIMVVGFADVVHLASAYIQEIRAGKEKMQAIVDASVDVGYACLITSATTFIGFIALSFVPNPMFRQVGIVLGFGVAIALILALVISPIVFSLVPPPPADTSQRAKYSPTRLIDGFNDRILQLVQTATGKHPGLILLVFVLGFTPLLWGVANMRIDANLNERMHEDHPVRVDEEFFHSAFSGTYLVDLYLELPEGHSILDPDILAQMLQIQQRATENSVVDNATSVANVISRIHTTMATASTAVLPDSRQAAAQYLLLATMDDPQAMDSFLSGDRRTARIAVRLSEGAMGTTALIANEVIDEFKDQLPPGSLLEASGVQYLMGDWLDEIIRGQKRGLMFALISIAIMMMIGTRSIRVGLWSMIPNVMPLLALGGLCALMWDYIDSDVMLVAMIAIGIGVDDTVHFLMRLRFEFQRTGDFQHAIRNTFAFAGRAIVITSVILVVGFAPIAMSNYFSVQIMGTLLPYTLVMALLADLLLLPALLQLGFGRYRK